MFFVTHFLVVFYFVLKDQLLTQDHRMTGIQELSWLEVLAGQTGTDFITPCVLRDTCHVSRVTCHVSHVMCHI